MYTLTPSGTDFQSAQVVVITCQACGYFEEHFRDRGLQKVGTPCDRCQGRGRKAMTQQNPLLPANINSPPQELPAAAEGLGPADVQRIGQFLDGSASDNTRASYRSAWKTFTRWAGSRAALALPASPALVAAYLSHLGGGAPPLGGHRPPPPRRPGRHPQDQWAPRPHRQRERPESAEGHRSGPRTGRQAG